MRQRHHGSMWISWCKGHATLHHIQQGRTDPRSAVFNGYADAAADEGHRGDVVAAANQVLDYLAKKQQRSIQLHLAIAKRITRVAKEVLARLEVMQKEAVQLRASFAPTPAPPVWPELHSGLWLDFGTLPASSVEPSSRQKMMEMRVFWTRLLVVPSNSEEPQGTAWLELFLLFSLAVALCLSA